MKCPYCAEEIQPEAIVCRYCQRDVLAPTKPRRSTVFRAARLLVIALVGSFAVLVGVGVFLASSANPSAPAPTLIIKDESGLPQVTASSSVPSDPAAIIRSQCATEWPTDFRMRAFCEDKQREGLAKVNDRPAGSSDLQMIRAKCREEWPTDFRMQNYCEEKQIDALRKLGR